MDPPEIPNENTSKEIKSVKARPTLPPLEPGSSDNFFGPTAPPFTGFNIGVTFGASTVTSGRGSNTLLFGPGRNLLGVEPVFPENPGGEVLEAVAGGDVAVVRHPPADRIGWTGMGGLSIGYNFAAGPVVIGGQLSVQGSAAGDSLIPLTPVGAFNPAVPNSFAPFNPIVPTGVMQISNGPAFGAGVRVGVPVSLFRYGELGINVPSFSVSPAAPNLFTYVSLGLRIQDVTVTVAPTTLWTEPGQPVGRLTHTSVRPTLGVGMEFQVGAVPDLGSIVVGLEYNHIFGSNSGLSSIPVQVAPGVIAPITMPATPQSENEVKAGVKLYFDALGRNQVM